MTTTLLTTFTNGEEAVKLLLRSFAHHNPDARVCLLAGDIESTDKDLCDFVDTIGYRVRFPQGTGHAGVLNQLCARVMTPYTLVMDFDVEVTAPFLEEGLMLLGGNPGSSCVALPDEAPSHLFPVGNMGSFKGVRRINPCCVLFDTPILQRMLTFIGWHTAVCHGDRTFYEVGSLLRIVLEASSSPPVYHAGLAASIRHYGQIGALTGGHVVDPVLKQDLERRYDEIRGRLDLYRPFGSFFRPCPLRA